jgi:hypothetical protein
VHLEVKYEKAGKEEVSCMVEVVVERWSLCDHELVKVARMQRLVMEAAEVGFGIGEAWR